MEQKDYAAMTPAEQLQWLTDFSTFDKNKLPHLCALGTAWEASDIKMMEEGLTLISAFAICREFVKDTYFFRDFARRVDRMRYLMECIKKEVGRGHVIKASKGETIVYVPSLQPSRRRGRPTKAETDASSGTDMDSEKAYIIAQLTGSKMVEKTITPGTASGASSADGSKAGKASKSSDDDNAGNNASQSSANEDTAQGSLQFAAAAQASEGIRLHLDQLSPFLSEALKADISRVSGLRALAAKESEQAKALAERGVDQAIIEPHSRAAVEYTKEYKDIYACVDVELGELYIKLNTDISYGGYKEKAEKMGISADSLLSILKVYFDKLGGAEYFASLKEGKKDKHKATTDTEKVAEGGEPSSSATDGATTEGAEEGEKTEIETPEDSAEASADAENATTEDAAEGAKTETDTVEGTEAPTDAENATTDGTSNESTAAEATKKELTESEKNSRLHSIRTYMLRKDVQLSAKRIETMKARIDEARSLGADVTEYEVILAKAQSDFEASSTQNKEN